MKNKIYDIDARQVLSAQAMENMYLLCDKYSI